MTTDVASIVLLSTLAGLGTGIGGLMVLVRIGCWLDDYAIIYGTSL
jgi:hypothetical protein